MTVFNSGNDKYLIIKEDEDNLYSLIASVEELMERGYRPVGGIATRAGSQSGAYLLQAMIKRDSAEDYT